MSFECFVPFLTFSLSPAKSLSFFFSPIITLTRVRAHAHARVPVPERAVAANSRAVAVPCVVVEVAAAAAPAGPVARDGDRADDDVGDVEARAPDAAVGVGPPSGPEVGGAVELD